MTKQRQTYRRPAVSGIFGVILTIGITVGVAGTLVFVLQDQIGISTSASSIQVTNLSVQRDGQELSITGTIKNTGSTSISSVTIDAIRVSDIVIDQHNIGDSDNPSNVLRLYESGETMSEKQKHYCDGVCTAQMDRAVSPNMLGSGSTDGYKHANVSDHKGFSLANPVLMNQSGSVLEGGRTQAFKLVLVTTTADDDAIEIGTGNNVRISDNLSMILEFRSGDDTLLSETYQARVRAG